tara:strand:- start:123 stop:350 length:228 start_codon:yes stop_codon:yes gene_type:complete
MAQKKQTKTPDCPAGTVYNIKAKKCVVPPMTKKESDIWKVYMAKGPLAPSFLDSSENAILDSMKHSKEFEIKKQR